MKKGILRVLSLALVAAMLLACASCTQTILVRFVDSEGNDLALAGNSVPANNNETPSSEAPVSEAPASQAPVSEAPASQAPVSEAPASQAPVSEAPASQAPVSEAPASQAPASEAPASQAPASEAPAANGMPTTKDAIVNFYKDAVAKVKNNGAAGYTKKEWQVLDEIKVSSFAPVNNVIKSLAGNFMTSEEKADNQECAKGSDDAKNRFPEFILSDYSKVASAKCVADGGNYKITIVLADEDTPKKGSSFIGQATSSILYWEDIDNTLKTDAAVSKAIKSYEGVHVIYKAFTITATITPDGKFVSLNHTAPADIIIGNAKLVVGSIENGKGHLVNYCTYKNFKY